MRTEHRMVIYMEKISVRPYEALYPVPTVLVSCRDGKKDNIITLAWVGTICSKPPMLSISIRPSRYSHKIITKSREFVVNVPKRSQLKQVDFCGTTSGKNIDKWTDCKFTKADSKHVNVPMIEECPVNIECKVTDIINAGAHDVFLSEILLVHQEKNIQDLDPIAYVHGEYWSIGEKIGSYGKVK